jgi:integrase
MARVPGLYRRGNVWWAKYYVNGRPVRESTGTEKETEAKRFLDGRRGRVATGQAILPRVDRLKWDEIRDDLKRHYETTGKRNVKEAGRRFKHLDPFFDGRRVVSIDGTLATSYIEHRQRQKAANGTINRELVVLVRALRLGYEHAKVTRLPVIHKLPEAEPRQGFFELDAFVAVRRRLDASLQPAVTIAHTFGWRMRSEVLRLERRHVDFGAGTIRLDPSMSKNRQGRLVYMTPDVAAMLTQHFERLDELQRKLGRIIPHVFVHMRGRRVGQRRKSFVVPWRVACKDAGYPGMYLHDFRRTAARNMVNAGVPETVAMKITGHKTRSVFDRYHIVSPGDLQEAARKLAGTFTGTTTATQVQSPSATR